MQAFWAALGGGPEANTTQGLSITRRSSKLSGCWCQSQQAGQRCSGGKKKKIDLAKGGSPKLKLSTINQVWPKQGEANPAVSTVFELFKEPLSSVGFTAEFQKQMLNIRYNLHVQPESQKGLCVGGVLCTWCLRAVVLNLPCLLQQCAIVGLLHNHNSPWSWIWADVDKCLVGLSEHSSALRIWMPRETLC